MKDAIMQNLRAVIANALMGREGDEGLKAKASEVFDQIGAIIAERDKALAEAERARRTLIAARGRMIALNQGNADLREQIAHLTRDLNWYREKCIRIDAGAKQIWMTLCEMFRGVEADMQAGKMARANELIAAQAEPLVLSMPLTEEDGDPSTTAIAEQFAPRMQQSEAA